MKLCRYCSSISADALGLANCIRWTHAITAEGYVCVCTGLGGQKKRKGRERKDVNGRRRRKKEEREEGKVEEKGRVSTGTSWKRARWGKGGRERERESESESELWQWKMEQWKVRWGHRDEKNCSQSPFFYQYRSPPSSSTVSIFCPFFPCYLLWSTLSEFFLSLCVRISMFLFDILLCLFLYFCVCIIWWLTTNNPEVLNSSIQPFIPDNYCHREHLVQMPKWKRIKQGLICKKKNKNKTHLQWDDDWWLICIQMCYVGLGLAVENQLSFSFIISSW